MKSRAASAVLRTLAHLFKNGWGQSLLDRALLVVNYLQGVGAGGDFQSSGEAEIVSRLKAQARANERPLCIFDVGANKGQFLTLVRSGLEHHDFHLHSFEPSAAAFQELRRVAGSDTRVTLNNFALAARAGEANLYYDAPGSALASLTRRDLGHFGVEMNLSETVRVETLDGYCADRQITSIDLLKIDVEGHELEVLNGARQMFQNAAIGMITFEFGGSHIDTRTFLRDFFQFFSAYGMRIARLTPSGYLRELSSYREVYEQFRTTNFVCFPFVTSSERRL